MMMDAKLDEPLASRKEQQGFRKGRSITDVKFITKHLEEKAMYTYNTPAFICILEITKAFDTVRWNYCINIPINERHIS